MKKSKISILLLLIVMILAISAVSAADTDDTSDSVVQAVDEAPIEEVASDDVGAVSATDDADVLAAAGDGNFTELQNSIDSSGTVIMSKDYTRVDGEDTISISKDVTLLGNNHKIDGNNLGGIFNVNSGYTLTLMGVTLINGNAENGGAIYNNGGTLTIVNSNFLNNTATKSGGAIYNDGGSITVTGSTFDGNDLTDRSVNGYGGAAIFTKDGDVLISTSTISNNLKDIVHRGGTGSYTGDLSSAAVSNKDGTLTVTDSIFESNSGSYGGAILSQGTTSSLIVSGSNFNNNFAFNGGAIYCPDGNYYISESNFTGNKVRGTGSTKNSYAHGGAIAATETASDCIISDCVFKDNSATMGGAISTTDTQVIGCTFINNTAQSAYAESFNGKTNNVGGYGAAIYSDKVMMIDGSTFINNTNTRNENVYLRNATVTNSVFVNTIVNVNKGPLTISNNTYDNAGKDIAGGNSPIIYFDGVGDIPYVTSGKVYLDASSFADLQAMIDSGSTGGIYLTGDITKLDSEYETFANGININRTVSIYGEGYTISSNNGKVFNVDSAGYLTINNAEIAGDGTAAITNEGTVSVGLTTNFTNVGDYAIENNGRVSQSSLTTFTQLNNLIALVSGGEVYIGSSKITKADDEKATFADGIVVEKDLTITGFVNYKGEISTYLDAANSGRIFSVNDGATLTLNKMILKNGNAEKGGAVYVEAANGLIAQTVDFINNTAVYRGGAIYSEGTVNVTDCVFDSNDITFRTANDDNGGAAIYNLKGILLIKDTKITNNLKDIVIRDGNNGDLLDGVVVTSGETIIDNAYFANNTGSWGGAISSLGYMNSEDYVLTVLNSEFEGNNATFGGAIFVQSSNLDVRNCTFENNKGVGVGSSGTSNTQGGAIVIFPSDTHAEIIDSTFIGNSANLGGAVSFPGVDTDTIVDNCTFIDNSAQNGGAVYFWSEDEVTLSVSNSDFIGNDASEWGGAIYSSGNVTSKITESSFEENTAAAATVVTFGNSSLTIDGCNFTENTNTYDWGVVTVYSTGDVNIENSKFTNDVTGSIAVDVEDNANVNVKDSKISTANNYGIWAGNGNISLENNDIDSAYVPVKASGDAEIISTVRANISENKTYNRHLGEITVTINLTDDNGNAVYDANLKFVVYKDGEVVFNESASFDGEKYTGTFTPTKPGTYIVTLDYPAQEVATAIYVVSSSLTDLKNKIGNDTTGSITLDMDYAYIAEFDEGLENGIVIDKNILIDGNGSTISGADLARLFNVTAVNILTLANVTVRDAKADKGAGVYVNKGAGLATINVNFINNTAVYRGGAIYSEGSVMVTNSVFDSNDITFRTKNDDNGGAAIYNLNGTLGIYNSNITNNLKNITIRSGNAGDLLVGVVVTSGTTDIRDSYFANNTGSWGGAISSLGYMNTEDYTLTVKNTKFEGNNATFGGAIFVESSKLVIDNSTFENNRGVGVGSSGTSNTQGGAIVVHPAGSSATITDSTFIANSANIGGAVSLAGVDGNSLIDNCTFTDNEASSEGGAVYLWTQEDATIAVEDSKFEGNTAPWGSAISNDGKLSLSNNTIVGTGDAIGNYYGVISSKIIITFLGNQTVPAEMGDIFILNATFTDDNGNIIDDPYFKFSVNGETIEDISYNETTGLYTAPYYIATSGPKVISTNYDAGEIEKLIGILDVPKANVTEFYVGTGTATKIPYGENVTIFVGLYGVNSEGLNKTIKVVVNNTEYTVTLTDGEGSFNVSGLAPGEYAAFAIFDGDDNYNGAYDTGLFNVLYPDAILSVVTQDITYGEDAVINISLTDADGTPLQGTLTIVVNDFVKMIDWTGENSISVPNLGANETGWRVFVSFAGDDLHTNVWNDTEIVKVAKATPGIDLIGPFDINVTENAEFSVTVDADVDSIALNIWIDGKEFEVIGPAEWNSNVAEFIIPASMLNEARDYNITVQYIGNDNYTASENVSQILTVNKIDISNLIQIEGSKVTYGANGTVTFKLPDDAEGTVTVILDGVDGIFTAEVVGGEAIVEIPNLDAGTYQLMDANYTGDNKYANWTHAGHLPEIEVKQANSQVIVTAFRVNDTYPGEVKVLYEIFNATSFKILVIDANSSVIYNETVVASEKIVEDIFTLKDLAAGIYAVIIENNETQNYAGSLGTSSFIIEKAVPVFTSVASEGAKVGDNVTITVTAPKDATGMVYLSVDGELIGNLTLEDGTAVFNVTDLDAGHHSYEVSYEGDANYTDTSDFNSFDVAKADVTVTITINETQIDLSGDLDVNVTVSGDATGYIKIDVNGIISVEELKDGNYSFTITDLAAGENTIEVTYLGDNNHNKANNTRKFTVPKKVPGIDLIGPDEITIGENAEFTVYIDAKADVYALNIWIDGKEFEAIGPAEWDSNKAEFIIPASMLNEARDYNITVQYIGNENYTASENASQILTVNKIDISNLIQIEGSTVTYGANGTVTFELPMDAEGTVTVILDGVDGIFTAEVAGGEAIVQIPGLNVGTYALIDANYTGDGKYANWTPNAQLPEIEVKQAKSMVVIASLMVNDTYPGEVYVGYYILNATTFKVLVLDENLSAIYNETVVANEKLVLDSFAVKGLAAGNYFVVIINNRTQNYDSDMDQKEFTIQKAVPVFTSVASEGAKVGDNVTITVTAPKDATGMVYLSVDGELIGNLTLEDGIAVFNVSGLDAGHHSYEVSYEGDANYTIASDFNSFEIAKADVTVTITIEESQIGVMGSPDVNVTVSGNATGYIKIDVDGIISVEELKDGNYTFQITDLTAGDYTIEVTYLGDNNYNKANETKTFTVPKSSPEIDAQVVASEITYGEDAEIIIDMNPDGAYGNVTIFVDNKEYATVVLDNDYANATAIISDLGVGTHNITITYNGNDNYNSITKAITNAIEVKQATSKVTIDPITNVTVGQSVVISYAVENETEVTIVIKNEAGVEQAYDIKDGKIVLSVEAGKYTVNITNAGNENVTGSSAIAAFEVAQNPEFDFNITFPENSTDSVFTITVPEDAVGYLLVDIDGQHYYAPVENGTASVTVPGLAPGNYTAAVTYTGDDKYPSSTVTKEVAVPSNLPEDALTIPETADTESPLTYSVNLPADATGYLIVDVDGTKYVAALENGSASITVPALSEGDHNVTVSYTGDSKYSSASKSSTLAVKKPVYKITNNKNVAAIYSAKAYYKVLVTKDGKAVGAGEKVTIKYNGKTYTVKTDSKGYATLKLNTKVKVKKYTITAEYKGVKVTNKVTIKHVIKAKNKKAKKSKKLKLKVKLYKVNGKYLKGKKVKLKFKGKTYKAKTNAKGKAKFTIKKKVMKKLKKGKKYKYKVTYGKDKVTKKIKVKK